MLAAAAWLAEAGGLGFVQTLPKLDPWVQGVAAGLGAGLALWAFAGWWRGVRQLQARRGIQRRAARGEASARKLLERAGFVVVGAQCRARWPVALDGQTVEVQLIADLIAERAGRSYVVEVKTGPVAGSVRHPPTRRQLMEYQLGFNAYGVLLVDADRGRIEQIAFPRLRQTRNRGASRWLPLAIALAGLAAAWWLRGGASVPD